MRLLGIGSVVAIIGVAGAAGALTIRGHENVTETSAGSIGVKQEGAAGRKSRGPRQFAGIPAPAPAPATPATSLPVVPAPASTPTLVATTPPTTSVAPVAEAHTELGPGRTSLTDSIFATRSGDSVLVSFDTHGNRTRRADKFESMVRTTLPLVYGRRVTAMLDSVPVGALLPSRDVVGELRTQGLHLRLASGARIAVWPQTRETSDGPLVVSYLAVVER